jgi:hypothetical protein
VVVDCLDDGWDCREGDSKPSDEADDDDTRVATAAGHMSCEKYSQCSKSRKKVHENPGDDRAGLKHSDPQANPLPAVTVHGMGRGMNFQHPTHTRVTRNCDTVVSH